ncbi:hypothetical protein H310_01698, partial [Aphanomyces invadans]
MDHAAISLELLREDNAELEKRLEEMEEEKQNMQKKHEELERKSKHLNDVNQLLQKRLHDSTSNKEQVPPTPNAGPSNALVQLNDPALDKEKAQIKTENDQLRQENEKLAKQVVHLRHDLERLYKRQKNATVATSNGDVDDEVAQLLDDQSTLDKKQEIIADLLQQCASKMEEHRASKRRRLTESLMAQEQMVKDAIRQFQDEIVAHQEFDRLEQHVFQSQSRDAAAATLQREEELVQWQKQCEQLQQDNHRERTNAESLRDALQKEALRFDAASRELEGLKNELAQHTEMATLVEKQTANIHELETQREQLRERLAAKEQYLLAQKEDTLTVLKNKADERSQWKTREANLTEQIHDLERTVAELTAQLNASAASHTTADHERSRHLVSQLNEAQAAREAAESARDDLMENLQKEIDRRRSLDAQLGTVLAQRDSLSDELLQVMRSRQTLQDQLDRQSEQCEQRIQDETERRIASQGRERRPAPRELIPVAMPDLDSATSQELQAFFVAYYECAETKHRALLAERDALLADTHTVAAHHATTAPSHST